MKHIKVLSVFFAAIILGSLIAYLMEDRDLPLRLNVTQEGYYIGVEKVTLSKAVDALLSYKGRRILICREYNASNDKLTAITDMIREAEYRSKGFISSATCKQNT